MIDFDAEYIRPYVMHQSGSIPGLPNPDAPSGLWPGGQVVYVDIRTMEVVSTGLIGGGSLPAQEAENTPLETPAQEQAAPVQEPGQEASN